jgi:DNA-binding NarL/FixJ family response regulator
MTDVRAPDIDNAGRPALRVAVIDDHELVREGLAALVSGQMSLAAEVVYCGGSVIGAAMASPDVAILDIDLGPGSTSVSHGVLALQDAGAKVLVISAFEDPLAVRSALVVGALGFVPKRVSVDALLEAIATVARGELYLSVDLAAILAAAVGTPNLSPRELDALRLYASGLKLSAVGHRMGISPHTAKEYLDRVRVKYANLGRAARTRTELYAEANRDGLLEGS